VIAHAEMHSDSGKKTSHVRLEPDDLGYVFGVDEARLPYSLHYIVTLI
jgi:hypothetical protein